MCDRLLAEAVFTAPVIFLIQVLILSDWVITIYSNLSIYRFNSQLSRVEYQIRCCKDTRNTGC